MNDFAISTQTISRSGLQGLPQRLVIDGLVADSAMIDAIAAAKERRVGVVSYLVEHNMADAREIAIAASQEFGAPLLDLDSIQPDLDTVRIVSEKILRKHRVLPLVKRGKKLFIAISDPTNLHALDEVSDAGGRVDSHARDAAQVGEVRAGWGSHGLVLRGQPVSAWMTATGSFWMARSSARKSCETE